MMLVSIKRLVVLVVILQLAIPLCSQVTVKMQRQEGGTFLIPGKINGLGLNFIFDTGASNVCISATEALFMLKNGYLNESDIKGNSYALIANGDIIENTEIVLRKVEVGGIVIQNVTATVVHNISAPLLFGQSAIQKLGPIQLDGDILIIKNGKDFQSDKEAWKYYRNCYQLVEAQKYPEAIESAKKGLSLTNNTEIRSWLYQELAASYFGMKDFDNAIEMCRKGLVENTYHLQLNYNLGYYLYLAGKKDLALRAFTHFIEHIPYYQNPQKSQLAAGYAYLGTIQAERGELKYAEKNLLQSIQYEPNSHALFQLGDVYSTLQNPAKAIECYKNGINFEPNRPSNIKRYYQLGELYISIDDVKNAISAFNNCCNCFDNNNENNSIIVFALFKDKVTTISKEDNSLTEDIERATEFLYYKIRSHILLGELYSVIYSYEKSLNNYIIALELPKSKTFFSYIDYNFMSDDYSKLGNREKALEAINLGLVDNAHNPDLLFAKSLLLNNSEMVITLLKEIINQEHSYSPRFFDYATVYNNLAWAYHLKGDSSKGLPYSLQSIQMNPQHDYSWETLGEIYFVLEKYQDCINAMTKCIELNPETRSAYEYRGKAKIMLGQKRDGEKDIKIANTIQTK